MSELLPRVIYLSSTRTGELLSYLKELPCEIVLADTENRRVIEYPPHNLGISFLYTHRIPVTEFEVPYRWVNFHPGPLPEFRGRNLAYHAILQKATHFGATIHYMDAQFDTGEIIEVVRFPIEPHQTAGDLVTLAHEALIALFKKHIPQLLQGKVASHPQPAIGAYYRKTVIDENIELTDKQIRRIRAVTVLPHFHATTLIGGRKYGIIPFEVEEKPILARREGQ